MNGMNGNGMRARAAGVLAGLVLGAAAAGAWEWQQAEMTWGGPDAVGVAADYDGDRIEDPALYAAGAGLWCVLLSGQGYAEARVPLGSGGAQPLRGDFDGDGRFDPAVYREATGDWLALLSGSGYQPAAAVLGGPGYRPMPADYDGDGLTDAAVYRPADGHWIVWRRVEPEIADPAVLAALFEAAVADARRPTASKIANTLTPVTPWNTNLVWSNGLVLVASFTRTYDYPAHVGRPYTNRHADAWVTAVPDLKRFFGSYAGTNPLLRVKQALGMPATVANDMIAEFWVDPRLLFRPSPDPEVTDGEATLDFSYTNAGYLAVSPRHVSWFTNQVAVNAWPWTRLGYTYDWGNSRRRVGLSEFVIPQSNVFIVHSIRDAASYLGR